MHYRRMGLVVVLVAAEGLPQRCAIGRGLSSSHLTMRLVGKGPPNTAIEPEFAQSKGISATRASGQLEGLPFAKSHLDGPKFGPHLGNPMGHFGPRTSTLHQEGS
eukprot:291572-Pyramimonas_sp.AAC.1